MTIAFDSTGKKLQPRDELEAEIERLRHGADLHKEAYAKQAQEIERLTAALQAARIHVAATSAAGHMMDGFGPRKVRPADGLLATIDEVLGHHEQEAR